MKVTVLIAAYNAEECIAHAVASALAQRLPPEEREVLVVDDGSTDETSTIVKGFRGAVRFVRQPHGGLSQACNAGLWAARGDYFLRLDADDTLEPGALAVLSQRLDADSAAGCVDADRIEIWPDGRQVRVSLEPFHLFRTIACGILFRTEQARAVGGYDELLFEEYDFLLRYLRANPRRLHVPRPLYRYVRHPSSMTQEAEYWERGWRQLIEKWGEAELARWQTPSCHAVP